MELERKAQAIVDEICVDDAAEGYCCRGLGWSDLDLLNIIMPALARFEAEVRGDQVEKDARLVEEHRCTFGLAHPKVVCTTFLAAALRGGGSRSEEGGCR